MPNKCQRCGSPKRHASIRIGKVGFRWTWIDLCRRCENLIRSAKR